MRTLYAAPLRKWANPARQRAPDAAVIHALRVPPCRFRQSAGRNRRRSPSAAGKISSTNSTSSKTGRNFGSTATATRKSGRARFRMSSAGVVRTQSPSDRSRMTATPAPRGRHSRTLPTGRLFFDLGLVDQHHGDVVANGVDAMALDALQAALVGFHIERGSPNGADEDLQQFFADSHSELFSLAALSCGSGRRSFAAGIAPVPPIR